MWKISKARNRKGFTLIELVIVIAIIIILAAIAIPNYLKMTQRAKKARIASEFHTLATALETYRTDWGKYPDPANEPVNDPNSTIYKELTGTATSGTNVSGATTVTGETGPVQYIEPTKMAGFVDPFDTSDTYYYTTFNTGTHWMLYAGTKGKKNGWSEWVYRTDANTALKVVTTDPSSTLPPDIPSDWSKDSSGA